MPEGPGAYAAEVARRAAAHEAAVRREAETHTAQGRGVAPPWLAGAVERVPCTELSVAVCRESYIARHIPVVITGLGPHLVPGCPSLETTGGVLGWLEGAVGNKRVGVYTNKAHLRDSFRGAAPGSSLDGVELVTVAELIHLVTAAPPGGAARRDGPEPAPTVTTTIAAPEAAPRGPTPATPTPPRAPPPAPSASGRYLYDLSVPRQLPSLLEHIRIPRYFAHDFLTRTMHPHAYTKGWPSLFVGEAGTHSSLHLDQWHGHFWMVVLAGRKRWTLFHPEDAHLLSPSWERGSLCPAFPGLRDMEARPGEYPLVQHARRTVVVVGPGDVLFVPGGTPHYVENLETTVSYAGNFIDASNYALATADIALIGARQGGAMAATFTAIDEVEYDADAGLCRDLLPGDRLAVDCHDFAAGKGID